MMANLILVCHRRVSLVHDMEEDDLSLVQVDADYLTACAARIKQDAILIVRLDLAH